MVMLSLDYPPLHSRKDNNEDFHIIIIKIQQEINLSQETVSPKRPLHQ